MRVLLVDYYGTDGMLDFAMRAKEAGHDVRWFFKRDDRSALIGKGLVPRVSDWREHMRWADLVMLSDNTHYLIELDRWRKEGVPIIGATRESATWELNRKTGQDMFKKAGIPVPPFQEFTRYDDAIAYVKKEGRAFVSKPSYDEADKSLSYVGKTPADLVYMLERWKKQAKLKGAFILQEKIKGCEMAVGAWVGPHGFNSGYCENWEFKSLMAGDRGPNVGEMGCYSEDSEVLTSAGWKYWPDVTQQDKLATLVEGALVFENPSEVVSYDYEGDMIAWQSKKVDILVTPNHNMFVARRSSVRQGLPTFFFEAAERVAANKAAKGFAIKRSAWWSGSPEWRDEARARLEAMILADGYAGKDRSIVFGNCPPHKEVLIRSAAAACGLAAPRYGPDVYINSKSLADQFRAMGKAPDKRVPLWVKAAPPATILAFLEGMKLDAAESGGQCIYSTASKGMADDLQELALKAGGAASITERDRRTEPDRLLKGYTIKGSRSWEVSLSFEQPLAWLRPSFCSRVPYKGKVYCATVSSHVLFVRRNGKPLWCGNTVLRYVAKSKLADKVLRPLEDMVVRTGHTGYFDVNCIIDEDGDPWPLEFTMRPGWPTFNIQQALNKGDPVEWLATLAAGRDSRPWLLDKLSTGVVMALPEFPYGKTPIEKMVGVPIQGITPSMHDNLHPCQIQMGHAPTDQGEDVVDKPCWLTAGDYVLVASGLGDSVRQSRGRAYRILEKIQVPASPFWRPDIGQRLKEQLPEIQKHGYASNMSF